MSTERNSGRIVLQSAALLTGAALVSKLIGTLQKIPLQNLGGDEVFGLYSAVNALAIMWVTLAAAGVPTAVSLLVAEREASGDETGARRVVRWALGLIGISGLLAFAVLQVCAPLFAGWMGAPAAEAAIRTSSIALLFAPAAAVLRGYRQGRMSMVRPAVSQVIEQTARVAFMLIMLLFALSAGWSAPAVAAAVHGGLAAGAAAGLAVMLWPERRRRITDGIQSQSAKKERNINNTVRRIWWREPRHLLVKRILAVAFPVAAASAVAPLLGLIDAMQVPALLRRAGEVSAMVEFGVYSRGIALLQLILMAASGAAAAMVPVLTGDRVRGDAAGNTAASASFALRMAWCLGGAAAIGMAILAEPINIMLFTDRAGSQAIILLAPAAVFGTVQAMSSGLLQGRGDVRSPAVNLAAAAMFKLALNILLVPAYGIQGAAAGMAAAYGAAVLLNALSLRQRLALPGIRLSQVWRPAIVLAAMAAAVAAIALGLDALTGGLPARLAALITALPSVAAGVIVLATGLVAAGVIGPALWRQLPGCGAGTRMDARLKRLHTALRRRAASSLDNGKDDPL